MKKIFVFVLFCAFLAASSQNSQNLEKAQKIVDELTQKYKTQKIVVLDPASIETLFMLGANDQIAAIATLQHNAIYPENETKKLESVGTFSNPSLEKIVALRPTLVILSSYSLGMEEGLRNFNIPSINLKADKMEQIAPNIRILAKLTNKQSEGERLISEFDAAISAFRAQPINKTAIYLYSQNPLMAFNDDSLVADILRLLGIKNLSPKTDIDRPIISSEFILKQNPDIVILGVAADSAEQLLRANPLLKNTKAAKNNAIFFNKKTHVLLRLSPQIIERIKSFKNALENGRFE